MIAFVLVGVRLCEVRDRLIELGGTAKVRRDRDAIAGPGVGAGERPAAEPRVDLHAPWAHLLDDGGLLPVPQLPHVVVLGSAAGGKRTEPPQEDVTRRLHEVLAGD